MGKSFVLSLFLPFSLWDFFLLFSVINALMHLLLLKGVRRRSTNEGKTSKRFHLFRSLFNGKKRRKIPRILRPEFVKWKKVNLDLVFCFCKFFKSKISLGHFAHYGDQWGFFFISMRILLPFPTKPFSNGQFVIIVDLLWHSQFYYALISSKHQNKFHKRSSSYSCIYRK